MLAAGLLSEDTVLCSFDVGDAFLQVQQKKRRLVEILNSTMRAGEAYAIFIMLPGQRESCCVVFAFREGPEGESFF